MKSHEKLVVLVEEAADLYGRGRKIPVDIPDLCCNLRVAIKRFPDIAKPILVTSMHGREIHLPSLARENQNFERFQIAHELGHHVLALHRAFPTSKSEYWKHENLCDRFARFLLVPPQAFHSPPPPSLEMIFSHVYKVAYNAKAPWWTVAQRFSDIEPTFGFLRIKRIKHNKWKVVDSTLPQRKEINRHIAADSPLGPILERTSRGTAEEIEPELLTNFPSFRSAVHASLQASKWDWRLAVRLAEPLSPG